MSGNTQKQVLDCTVAPCFSIIAIIDDMLLFIREAHLRKQLFNSNKRDEVVKLDGSVWRVGVIVCGGMMCRGMVCGGMVYGEYFSSHVEILRVWPQFIVKMQHS